MITITSIGEGKILPSTGQARFKTTYTAVVMKPFKGEVVDAKVVNVNKVGQSEDMTPPVFSVARSMIATLTFRADGILRDGRTAPGLRLLPRERTFSTLPQSRVLQLGATDSRLPCLLPLSAPSCSPLPLSILFPLHLNT